MLIFTQIAAASALYSTLAGLSFTTGAAGAVLATGGSFGDAVALYDQFFAGYADSVTFGGSTLARRLSNGETATRNHKGLYFNLGRLAGGITGAWLGSGATTFAKFSSAHWIEKALLGYDIFGAVIGLGESAINIQKGRATLWDVLSLLPFLGWFNINYQVVVRGLGSNLGNVDIIPRPSNKKIQLYRSTDFMDEIRIYRETGYIMSDAARDGYNVARYELDKSIKHSIEYARKASRRAHKIHLDFWHSLDDYLLAHNEGIEYAEFAAKRSMISFTTTASKTSTFYTPSYGQAWTREVNHELIIPQIKQGANEDEVLILHMIKNFRVLE